MNHPRRHTFGHSKRLYWEGVQRWRARRLRDPRRPALLRGSTVSGFMMMGSVAGLSLANHSNSESFLVAQAWLSQDGRWREGFWEVDGHAVSPFNLSRALPVGGGSLVLYSLSGSPVIKQLMHMVTMVPGQGGRFQSCASPNRMLMFTLAISCLTTSNLP